jgi:hypothetical protein
MPNPAAEVVTVLETMREFRHSEPGLVMYPYGGSGTRVPLRSDTNKVVASFFLSLIPSNDGFEYTQETYISTRKRGKNDR